VRQASTALVASLALLGSAGYTQGQQRGMKVTIEGGRTGNAQVVSSVDALPAHIATSFREPIAFTQVASGQYLVLDRRAQAVYGIDRSRNEVTRLVQIGEERGRIIRPAAFGCEPDGTFVVVDQPDERERIQRFADRGFLLNGFTLTPQPGAHLVMDGVVLGGIGSVQFTGDSIFVSQPQTGSLITEYSWNGRVRRAFGSLRPTGHESDAALHASLNTGLPLVDPTGGFFFVFQTGVPVFRRYDAAGTLEFERHVEGRDLDQVLKSQPAVWPKRQAANGKEWPVVPPVIRAAAVDPRGNLWIALATGGVYVYSPDGDKIRSLQLRAAGPLSPTSLFFAGPSRLLVTPGCYIFDVSFVVPGR
jgi:hypothetical protein